MRKPARNPMLDSARLMLGHVVKDRLLENLERWGAKAGMKFPFWGMGCLWCGLGVGMREVYYRVG